MAKKLSDEEREKRIKLVTEYAILNNTSARETAKFFKEHFFPISNVTVSDYFQRYIEKYKNDAEAIKELVFENTVKTVEDREIKARVLKNAKLIVLGWNIEDIAKDTNINYWTVYRDLTIRLPKIDNILYEEVHRILFERRKENLKK